MLRTAPLRYTRTQGSEDTSSKIEHFCEKKDKKYISHFIIQGTKYGDRIRKRGKEKNEEKGGENYRDEKKIFEK